MNLRPSILQNRFVALEPLAETHKAELREACEADPEVWPALYPFSMAGPHFDPRWRQIQADVQGGQTIAYAVLAGGRCGGISCLLNIDLPNASLEIGATYYRPELRGGPANPAAKRLLLAEAFDSGARRVSFRVDAINHRSRAAVAKLGAVQEGVLRQDRRTWTGRVRDTVIFSVLKDEWPAVRKRLDARLAAFD